MVPLPTPPGPDTTMMRGGGPLGVDCDAGGSAKLLAQGLTLLLAEALDPAVLGDADLLHQPTGLDLPDAREGLEEGDDLEATDGVVRVGPVQGLVQGERAHLELLLHHGEGLTGLGRLLQRGF